MKIYFWFVVAVAAALSSSCSGAAKGQGAAVRAQTDTAGYAVPAAAPPLIAGSCPNAAEASIPFPGPDPKQALARVDGDTFSLSNNVMAVSWSASNSRFVRTKIENRVTNEVLAGEENVFAADIVSGAVITPSDMKPISPPVVRNLTPDCTSPRLADRLPGKEVAVDLGSAPNGLSVSWRAVLRDGANTVREEVTLRSGKDVLDVRKLTLLDIAAAKARRRGVVDGSVVTTDSFFFGYEHPMAENTVDAEPLEIGTVGLERKGPGANVETAWDVSQALAKAGSYTIAVTCPQTVEVKISQVRVLDDGKEILGDSREARCGAIEESNAFVLTVKTLRPGAVRKLQMRLETEWGGAPQVRVLAVSQNPGNRVLCGFGRGYRLASGRPWTQSAVIGVYPKNQLRRAFLAYLERERAHGHRPFLHYNTWYDIAFGEAFDEKQAADSVTAFGRELFQNRGVTLDSFMLDDGWDDPRTLWGFHGGFPKGFTALRDLTERYGAAVGTWLSPWGGYGKAKDARLKYGAEAGYEIDENGFVLAGPKYYARFGEICLEMIKKYGVNQFKFDGTGRTGAPHPKSQFGSDFEAAIALMTDLRAAKADVFINLTTGTWPSPFFLRHADSVWRGGLDNGFAGQGTDRQKWLTYRDGMTFRDVVERGPLYPLNSLMVHGVLFAKLAERLDKDPSGDLRSEIRSYFGNGTNLQEMYVTPGLLSKRNWDDLAESAKWARKNAASLCDTHWVGGDPLKGEIYGWASWSKKKAIVTLRNPSDKAAKITLDLAAAFEIPDGIDASGYLSLEASYPDQRIKGIAAQPGKPLSIDLEPFEVLVFETAS